MAKQDAALAEGEITIADIARRAGVHPGTVSRALRDIPGKVSDEKRQEIKAIALELGYQPNTIAASLRTKQTDVVAIIVPDIANPLFAPIVQALEKSLREQRILTLVAQTPEDASQRCELVRTLIGRHIRGLLVLAAESRDPMLDIAAASRIPTVLINRGQSENRFSSVVNDDARSIELALDHLRGLGHRSVAHIAGPRTSSTGEGRRLAFEKLTAQAPWENCVVLEAAGFTRQAGAIATRHLMAMKSPITAIVAANDLIALGILDALREQGLRIPQDISVVGHNDMLFADALSPALTTVHVAAEEMGCQAASILLSIVEDRGKTPQVHVLTPSLIVRDSTGPATVRTIHSNI